MANGGMFFGGSGSGASSAISTDTPLGTSPSIFKTPTVGSFLTGFGSLYSGVESYKSSKKLASDLRYEGGLAMRESFRTASIIREEGREFRANQSLQYIGSGVELVGSALVTLAHTKKMYETEAGAEESRGVAQANLANKQARVKEDEGRADLISGIIKAGASIFL